MGIIRRIKRRLMPNTTPTRPKESPQSQAPRSVVSRFPDEEEEPMHVRGEQDVAEYVDEVLRAHRIVLFMKGSPTAPQCGFSATACAALSHYKVDFHHVDVILDEDARGYIKAYSKWPTIPQLYVDREFIGGSDIVMQMHESEELGPLLTATKA